MIEIQNFTARKISEEFIKKIIHTTVRFEGRGKDGTIYMGVVLVGEARMRVLHRSSRGKNRATDVLSFSGGKNFITPQKFGKYLGEIILCPQVIQKHASKAQVRFEREFAHVLIHGTLHLLGYTHEESVKAGEVLHAKEEKIISQIFSG